MNYIENQRISSLFSQSLFHITVYLIVFWRPFLLLVQTSFFLLYIILMVQYLLYFNFWKFHNYFYLFTRSIILYESELWASGFQTISVFFFPDHNCILLYFQDLAVFGAWWLLEFLLSKTNQKIFLSSMDSFTEEDSIW